MPIVIDVENERVFDTHYVIIKFSDKTSRIIEIEEGAEKGEEISIEDKKEGET